MRGDWKVGVMEITREGGWRERSMRREEGKKPISRVKSDLCRCEISFCLLVVFWSQLSISLCLVPLSVLHLTVPVLNTSKGFCVFNKRNCFESQLHLFLRTANNHAASMMGILVTHGRWCWKCPSGRKLLDKLSFRRRCTLEDKSRWL